MPDFEFENAIDGLVCGIDEVGRGPLAGPVVAACVYVPDEIRLLPFIEQIQDSKTLSKGKLLTLYALVTQHCTYGIGQCSPAEIDEMNILQASLEAMRRAYADMGLGCVHALVDGNKLPKLPCSAQAVVKGDNKSVSIAAAAIVAKVTRDRYMAKLAVEFPYYGWERNAAYPSKEHREALLVHGITPHHRKSFAPVRRVLSA